LRTNRDSGITGFDIARRDALKGVFACNIKHLRGPGDFRLTH